MTNIKQCSKCYSIYDNDVEIYPNADEEAGMDLRFHGNWVCRKCLALSEKQKLLKMVDILPNEFISLDNIEFYSDKIVVRYKLNDTDIVTKSIKL